jgi:hypothetical protein
MPYAYYSGPMPQNGGDGGSSHVVVASTATATGSLGAIRLTTGAGGAYLSVSASGVASSSVVSNFGIAPVAGYLTPNLCATGNGDLTIKTKGKVWVETEDGQRFELLETIRFVREIADRLKVLAPIIEQHEVYPALASAYDRYRVVARLCRDDES